MYNNLTRNNNNHKVLLPDFENFNSFLTFSVRKNVCTSVMCFGVFIKVLLI